MAGEGRRAQQVDEMSEDGFRIIERNGRYFVEMWGTEGRVAGKWINTYGTNDALLYPERATRGWATIESARRFIQDQRFAVYEIHMMAICNDCEHSGDMGVTDCDCWCHRPQYQPLRPRGYHTEEGGGDGG